MTPLPRTLKLLTVVGARPQFVKAAVVSRAVAIHNGETCGVRIDEEILHTGQHYDPLMSDVFFREMDIPRPVVNLGVGSGGHGETTGAMLAGIEKEILARKPDCVLVYGDTNSTLAGALAAAKLHVPVAHVEAGLRSFNRRMPEEINRVLVDHVAKTLFCPSQTGRANLAAEGITSGVHVVGDVMYDAVLHYRAKAIRPETNRPFALATLHRAENTDNPERLGAILTALAEAPLPIILPLHPRTRKLLDRHPIVAGGAIEFMEPLSYLAMLGYLERAAFVVTDSGGVQKEAYFLGKRCITVRDETEWTELVACGANRVVGADPAAIRDSFSWAVTPLCEAPELYGQGDAGTRIVRHLLDLAQGCPSQ
jgi:UDP-GlcNAc3NAcA epimerase